MGHSFQVVSILVSAAATFFAVPLSARIHEGLVFSNRDKRTLPQKFLSLVGALGIAEPVYLVADAYYACCTMLRADPSWKPFDLPASQNLRRVRADTVDSGPTQARSSQAVLDPRSTLFTLFEKPDDCLDPTASPSTAKRTSDPLSLSGSAVFRSAAWPRFVLVEHPDRGRIVFLVHGSGSEFRSRSIRLYGLRFKSSSPSSRPSARGFYGYHFWMMTMDQIGSRSGGQYLHRKIDRYRDAVRRKLAAYRRFIQTALIAQGVLQCVATACACLVWSASGSWLCTIRPGIPPSELVVMIALEIHSPDFLHRFRFGRLVEIPARPARL